MKKFLRLLKNNSAPAHPILRVLRSAALVVVLFCLVVTGLLYFFQHHLIYLPRRYGIDWRTTLPRDAVVFDYRTSQGPQVGILLPARTERPERVLFLFSGNATVALDWLNWTVGLQEIGTSIVLLDYPGYGANSGRPSPESIRESIRIAWKELNENHQSALDTPEIILYGHSLGAAAALIASQEIPATALVLVAPFTSTADIARQMVGPLFARLLHHRFDNVAILSDLAEQPDPPRVLILHGTDDGVISVEMGRRLSEMFPDWITYAEIDKATHDSLVYTERSTALEFIFEGTL